MAWVCEYFDASSAPSGSAASLIARSSNPRQIYEQLQQDCSSEDDHSALIMGYKKTFRRLAKDWLAAGIISSTDSDEIFALINSKSWKIWHPRLYVIPRAAVENTGRLVSVKRPDRASSGPEMKVIDLKRDEFDIIVLHP